MTGTFEAEKDHIVPIYGLYNNDTTEVVINLEDGTFATFEVATEDINVDYGTIQTKMKTETNYDYENLTFICSTMGSLYAVDAAGIFRFIQLWVVPLESTNWKMAICLCLLLMY